MAAIVADALECLRIASLRNSMSGRQKENGGYDAAIIPPPSVPRRQIIRFDNGEGPPANHIMPVADLLRAIANFRPLLWG